MYLLQLIVTTNLLILSTSFAQEICCAPNKKSREVCTLNMTIQQIAEASPIYEVAMSVNQESQGTVSTCNTFFKLTDTSYLVFRVTVWANGGESGSQTEIDIISDYPGKPGVLRAQGLFGAKGNDTTVQNRHILDVACDTCNGPVYAAYNCFIFDYCSYVRPNKAFLFGLSSSPNITDQCLNKLETKFRDLGFKGVNLFHPPATMVQCVTRYNGAKCVNANRVSPADSINYPQKSQDIYF